MQAAHASSVPEHSVAAEVEPRRTWPRDLALLTVMAGVAGIGAGILIAAGAGAYLPWVDRLAVASGVTGAVGLCATVGQTRTRRDGLELAAALEERERAIASLLSATRGTSESAARLRLLFDSAVDGVVELDDQRRVVRANDSFCSMIQLPFDAVIGVGWDELASRSPFTDSSLAELPTSGESVLTSDEGTRYLEARSSPLATSPPGSLLVIRDGTASRLAEQTIRSLFQFLQNRDEDRTSLLLRTNAAIEAERNRIARDLHDGPIQGVTGATLSLEAVRLMVEAGDQQGAADMLKRVQEELAEEADSLRRVMSDLRPPVLEERGLVPAIRELCRRFERERGIKVQVAAGPYVEVPADTETLAYRVVQEALSNVGKHAGATQVSVRAKAGLGTLEVEISDDGCGFDPREVRDFLRMGKVGLASMRERTELGGGTLVVQSKPRIGTTVVASLPCEILASVPTIR